jgi:hypothetical protein
MNVALLLLACLGGGDAKPPAPPLALERLKSIETWPPRLELTNRFATAQVVVTGELDDGSRGDVTRAATFADANGLVAIDARGRATPVKDGDTQLQVCVGSKCATIAVHVSGAAARYEPSFVNDVVPTMSKLGCNAGTCHGSAKGKNGFKLSLRGYDPIFDHVALTDDLAGRRFNRAVAEQSLFLLKPTASVPHEGGERTTVGSREYELLKAWVESGVKLDPDAPRVVSIEIAPQNPTIALPGASQQFAVVATYADGRRRDVTDSAVVESNDLEVATVESGGLVTAIRRGDAAVLARYCGRYASTRLLVMGDRSKVPTRTVAQNNWIDQMVDAKLAALKTPPSGPCTDAEFVRRLFVDLTGKPPSSREVRSFLADHRDSKVKRDELIERLIGGVEFVEHWTNKWSDLLQVNSKFLGVEGAGRLRDWIREQIASNRPYDEFAASILGATGSTYQNPAAAYWKILRQPTDAMENTTQLFLGVRFSCNKCHDHPFERWTLDQHWQLAAFFAQVGRQNVPGSPMMAKANDNRPDDDGLAFEEMVADVGSGEVMHPTKNVVVAPAFPYHFEGESDVPGGGTATATRRDQFVRWLANKNNPYFAKSYVNRLWSYFTGVGLIEPVDDLRASNPPTNPELLDRLTQTFVDSHFDVRALMELICRSATYQRSLATDEWNGDDSLHYAHATARRLPAETLFDAIVTATGHVPAVSGARPDARAEEFLDPTVQPTDNFLALFGRPPRESACECERASGMSLGQALSLVNGPTLAEAIEDPNNAIARFVAYERDPRKVVDELYLRFLARPATDAEFTKLAPSFDAQRAANVAALPPAVADEYHQRRAAWESTLPKVVWQPLADVEVKSANGQTFTKQGDGSWLAGGTRPDKDTYTVLAYTKLEKVTGVRIDAIPDASLPMGGSGRSDSGNFVLGEMKLAAIALAGSAGTRTVALQHGSADFTQPQFSPDQIADGNPVTGWAIYPNVKQPHRAAWELSEDVGAPGGTLLVLTIDQGWGGGHLIGRFKLSVTTSARPVAVSMLSDELIASLAKPAEQRTDDDEAAVHRLFLTTAPDLAEKFRLGAAQDLSWGLATSSAFLFQR